MSGAHRAQRESSGRVAAVHRHKQARNRSALALAYEAAMHLLLSPAFPALPVRVVDVDPLEHHPFWRSDLALSWISQALMCCKRSVTRVLEPVRITEWMVLVLESKSSMVS